MVATNGIPKQNVRKGADNRGRKLTIATTCIMCHRRMSSASYDDLRKQILEHITKNPGHNVITLHRYSNGQHIGTYKWVI